MEYVFPHLQVTPLSVIAERCRLLAVIPHHSVGSDAFAEGFNRGGGFLFTVPFEVNPHLNTIVAVYATRTVRGLDVLFVVTSSEDVGAYT